MNIATLLRRATADHAGQVALRLDDTEIGYAQFAEQGARFAAHLHETGVAADRVGFYLPNCAEYLVGLPGTWQAGDEDAQAAPHRDHRSAAATGSGKLNRPELRRMFT